MSLNIKKPEFDEGISVVFADYHGLPRDKKKKKTLFISYDLGGGTLDIAAAIMWQTRKGLNWQDHGRLVGYAGDNNLGGDLITDVIGQMLCESLGNLLSNRELLNIFFANINIYGIEINDFDHQKAKVFFPVKYIRNWMRDEEYQFDFLKVQENLKKNSIIIKYLADNIKINYFSNYPEVFSGSLIAGLFIAQENDGVIQITSFDVDIIFLLNLFFDKVKIILEEFLEFPVKTVGSSVNFKQKFNKLILKIKLFIVSNICDVESVRIVLAGNGSRFQYATDTIQKLVTELEEAYDIPGKIEVIGPDVDAKKLVSLGYSKKMASKITGDFYPVYSVIQNSLYYTRTNIDPQELSDLVFEPIFHSFQPFCKNILSDSPDFIIIESEIIQVNLEDQLMVQQGSLGFSFTIYSDKKDLPDFAIGSLLIPHDLNPVFRHNTEIDGEKYSCIFVQFNLVFNLIGGQVSGFEINAKLSAFFVCKDGNKISGSIKLNGPEDSQYLSNIILVRE